VGNEGGHSPDPCRPTITYAPGESAGNVNIARLGPGTLGGEQWIPAEVDVSIRPGWFWHESQNGQVKTLEQLLDIYYASVGRGCNLLLNVPPDRRGLFHEIDVERLGQLGDYLKGTFAKDLAAGRSATADNTRGNSAGFSAAKLTDGDRNTYWAADDDVLQPNDLRQCASPGAHSTRPARRIL
jgi:alpha-L-fucosidase